MVTSNIEAIENRFEDIEHRIIYENNPYSGRMSSMSWNGIDFQWKSQALKNGGTVKRNHQYGNIHYSYLEQELTRAEAIQEASKPASLRNALVEAGTMIECSVCGLVVVGKDAMNPYQSTTFQNGNVYSKKPWGLIFWRMRDNNEPMYLNFCPNCLQRIANGEFRDGE